jgi:hypothetical protein
LWGWHVVRERQTRQWAENVAVVVEPAYLHTGNNAEFPRQFNQPLPVGVETTPLDERGGWIHVRLPGGTVGWLPSTAVLR